MSISVMIDTETMSTNYNAALTQIGAVKFDDETGEITSEFIVNISLKDCVVKGLHVDQDTVAWWQKQNPEVLKAMFIDPVSLEDALNKLTLWYGSKSMQTWVNGANFDPVIMKSAYLAIGRIEPWKYWDICDFRTVTNLSKVSKSYMDGKRAEWGFTYHSALDDAKFQTKMLIELLS